MNNSDFKRAWNNFGKAAHEKATRTPQARKGDGTFAAPQSYDTPTGLPPGPQAAEKSDEDTAYDEMWNGAQSREPRYAQPEGRKPSPQLVDKILESWNS